MSLASHFRWGYATQLASIVVLAATNVVLPNVLGIETYAELTEFYAYMGISVTILHEGATLLSLRQIATTANPARDGFPVALRASAEFGCIALALFFVVNFATLVTDGDTQLGALMWGLLGLSVVASAVGAPLLAWKVASHENRFVTFVTFIQGLAALLLPIVFVRIGIDVRAAVFLSLVVVIVVCLASASRSGTDAAPSPRSGRVLLSPELVSASAPSFLNVGVTTLPILFLAQTGALEEAAVYKIGVSVMIGAALLVPVSRRTLLSILARGHVETAGRIANAAIVIAALASVWVIFLAPYIADWLFSAEYAALGAVIPALALMITLQVAADVFVVQLLHAGKRIVLIAATVAALLALVAVCVADEARFAPAATLGTFIVAAALAGRTPAAGEIVPWSGLLLAVPSALVSLLVGGSLGAALGTSILVVGVVATPRLRASVRDMLEALRGAGH